MDEPTKPQPDRREKLHTVGMRIALEMRSERLTSEEMRDVLARQAIAWAGMSMEDIPKMKANLVRFVARIEELFTHVSLVGLESLKAMRQALLDRVAQSHLGPEDGSFEGILVGCSEPEEGRPSQVVVKVDDGDEIMIDRRAIGQPDDWIALHRGRRIRVDYRGEGDDFKVQATVLP